MLDGCGRPSFIMTRHRNVEPVQFIQPNVLDRACLSIGTDDGFADQLRSRSSYSLKMFDARTITVGIARPVRTSHLCCPGRLNAEVCPSAQHWE
nr:hypothetical protein CDS [Bradyrhizobium sp.]